MSIILREPANPCQPVQFPALLVAIYRTEFCKTNRKIFIRPRFEFVHLAVVRAVHRFQHEFLPFLRGRDDLKTILTVLLEVSRSLVQIHVTDMRGDHLLVTVLLLYLAQEGFQTISQHGSLRQPHRKSRTNRLREHEQLHLLTNLTMIALFCLLHQYQPFVQHFLFRESDTVYTG